MTREGFYSLEFWSFYIHERRTLFTD